jgi:hypothetical protein
MRFALAIGSAVVLLAAFAGPTTADMTVYYRAGRWDAFSGPGSDGKMICGIGSTNPADSSTFSLRFTIGGDSVLFQARKPNWSIPSGTEIPVVMQIGLDAPWTAQATGDGQEVQWSLDRTAMQTFDSQFRLASSMTISFPSGNEPPWAVALGGSTAISNAFGRCVTTLAQRSDEAPTQPTQPFGQTPAQPTVPR